MLLEWIDRTDRAGTGWRFDVVDLVANRAAEQEEIVGVAELIRSARIRPEVGDRILQRAGWPGYRERVGGHVLESGRRGEWGEAVLYGLLEEILEYDLPIKKLRLKLARNQFQPGTDIVAFRVEDEAISEVAFLEVKLRSQVDAMAAVAGYRQLKEDATSGFADILAFTDEVLAVGDAPFGDLFRGYLTSREDWTDIETFHVVTVFDESHWTEKLPENLHDEGPELLPLWLIAVRFPNLVNLMEKSYELLGMSLAPEDD